MNDTSTYFFPGPRPYRAEEADHFWGRDHFITQISRYLDHERLVILTSPTGAGKTSLLQAGLIPQLKELRGWQEETQIIQIRFTPYNQASPIDPLSIFEMSLLGSEKAYPSLPYEDTSAWLILKAYLAQNFGTASGQRVVLIFDQFEELFTYPEACVTEFLAQIGDIHSENIPPEISKAIKRKRLLSPNECNDDFQRTVDWLNQPLCAHTLLAVEGNVLFQLEELINYIPEALSRTHELPPLQVSKVYGVNYQDLQKEERELSILNPWYDYQSPCRNLRLQLKLKEKELAEAIDKKVDSINPNLTEFYERAVKSLGRKGAKQVKSFFEDQLLDSSGNHRRHIKENKLSEHLAPPIIEKLKYFGLIRAFDHYRDGNSYELSHECWRKVIVEDKKVRLLTGKVLKSLVQVAVIALLLFTSLGFVGGVITTVKTTPKSQPSNSKTHIHKVVQIVNGERIGEFKPQEVSVIAKGPITRNLTRLNYHLTFEALYVDTVQIDSIPTNCSFEQCEDLRSYIIFLEDSLTELWKGLPCPSTDCPPVKFNNRPNPTDVSIMITDPRTGQQKMVEFDPIHTVEKGDNLFRIASKYCYRDGVTNRQVREAIKILNNLKSEDDVPAGQNLKLPGNLIKPCKN